MFMAAKLPAKEAKISQLKEEKKVRLAKMAKEERAIKILSLAKTISSISLSQLLSSNGTISKRMINWERKGNSGRRLL